MATVEKHIFVQDKDSVGRLAEITGRLKDAGVNIYSLVGYVEAGQASFILGTSDNAKALKALKGSVKFLGETQVLVVKVPDKVGTLHGIASKIAAAGISIGWACATTTGGEAALVFSTSDNAKAAGLV
jgi:hypothetical protein